MQSVGVSVWDAKVDDDTKQQTLMIPDRMTK